MIADFADLCTHAYVLVDELYRLVAVPHDQRPGPPAAFSDSELITLTLVAELLGLDAETRFLAYVRRNHLALFPLLPERSRYNRRRRQLIEVTNRIRGGIMARLWRGLGVGGRGPTLSLTAPAPPGRPPHTPHAGPPRGGGAIRPGPSAAH